MKLKLMPILAGAIALTIAAVPLAVKAERTTSMLAQATPNTIEGMFLKKAGINLTDAQKSQMAQIRQATEAKINAILTPEQQAKFKAIKETRQRQGSAIADMNLSDSQKAQIMTIMMSAKSQAEAVLTPEQQAKIQQLRQNFQQRRGQGNQSSVPN